jgi:signal recognition particle subunit SRP54
LRPDTLEVKLLEKHVFRTGAVVVDLRPSEPVRDGIRKPGEAKEPLKSAGEVLLLDRNGQLIARNELDDDEDVRRLMFRDEGAAPADAAGGEGMMPGGMMPGGMMPGMMPGGMPGMPGMPAPGGEGKAGKGGRGKAKGGF